MRFIWVIVLVSWISSAQGQIFEDYRLLESTGLLSKDFTHSSLKKYEIACYQISKSLSKEMYQNKKHFYLQSTYLIDELLKSGKVLFNDPVTQYVNRVADNLLSDDEALRRALRFYVVKSPIVNAFATNDGIIFVNMGLLSQLETEAQLAFILAHEITHFTEKHALELYIASNQSPNIPIFSSQNPKQSILDDTQFSKELEIQADKLGLNMIAKTPYSLESIESVFDILKYAYLPFENKPFDKTFFETKHFKFPDHYFLSDLNPVLGFTEQSEANSLHPSLNQRKNIVQQFRQQKNKYGQDFLLTKEKFKEIRTRARFELSYYYLNQNDYYKAIYNSYLLLKNYPQNKYLNKIIAKSLYGLTKHRNHGKKKFVFQSHKHIEGASQQLYYFINSLQDSELNVLAVQFIWKLSQQFPFDKELKELKNDVFQEMVDYHYADSEFFYVMSPIAMISNQNGSLKSIDTTSTAKPIKRHYDIEQDFIKYAFIEYMNDSEFLNFFKKCQKEKARRAKKSAYYLSKQGKQDTQKKQKKVNQKGHRLGINRLVVVNPYYLKLDLVDGKNQKLYEESEKAQIYLRNRIKQTASSLSLNTTMLDVKHLRRNDTKKFNALVQLNDWFNQQMDFEELKMPGYLQEDVVALAKLYKTNYFVWIGVVGAKGHQQKENKLYKAISPKFETLFYAMVFNIKTRKLEMAKVEHIKSKDSKSVINSHLYDTFFQIKERE